MMNIERLQQAAVAAGYAMAAVEDENADDFAAGNSAQKPAVGTALMLAPPVARQTPGSRDTMVSGSAWLKSLLPAFAGGATA